MDIGTEFSIDKIAESATLFAQAAIIDGVADANARTVTLLKHANTLRAAACEGARQSELIEQMPGPAARAVRFTDFMGRAARFLTWVREQL